ncbi:MAG: hypothetical protein WDW36_009390 [Sanguina aurantia]
MADDIDIAELEAEAREAGFAEIVQLLSSPEDLSRLGALRAQYESHAATNKALLSNTVQSQVEAAQTGMDALDKAHRHIMKLRGALQNINELCEECSELLQQQGRVKALALTHGNVQKVLSEIEDIIDLPARADMCSDMLRADGANLVPAFEALTVLEGISNNAMRAWVRSGRTSSEMSHLALYLDRVSTVMAIAEGLLWEHVRNYDALAREAPALLVDCLRIVELQEQLDKQYGRVSMDHVPKRYREKLFLVIETLAEDRFEPLELAAESCGEYNKTIRYDSSGDIITREERDPMGKLVRVTRVTRAGEETIDDPQVLRNLDLVEEAIFDEAQFLDDLLEGLYARLDELAAVYDYVAPCFPPAYTVFENVSQTYHVHFAIVIDVLGRRATTLSNKGSLRVMEWVQKYMATLRNLGVDEAMVRLGMAPSMPDSGSPQQHASGPDVPGLVLLMQSFVARMEATMTRWYQNILAVDLQGEPKPAANGTLCTPGAIDFFRILSEEMQVIEDINDHGDVMFNAAVCSLRVMKGFQESQLVQIANTPLAFEMCCAMLNNNVLCHDQSEEFAEGVQAQLEERYRALLHIDSVCRGFLDVAKAVMLKLVETIFNDPGTRNALRGMYMATPDYLTGTATKTLIATLKDYFSDINKYVQQSFVKRVAEAALDELVRRLSNSFVQGMPPVSPPFVQRMRADEDAIEGFFELHLKPDRMQRQMGQIGDMREIMSADGPTFVLSYTNLLAIQPTFSPEMLQKLLASRTDMPKKESADALARCREVWKQRVAAGSAATAAATAASIKATAAAAKEAAADRIALAKAVAAGPRGVVAAASPVKTPPPEAGASWWRGEEEVGRD